MIKRIFWGVFLLLPGLVPLGGCSLIHRSACGWNVVLTGGDPSSGCAQLITGHPAFQSLPTATSPVKKPGFTVQLPQGKTWRVIRNETTGIAVASMGEHRDESYVISAHSSNLPDLATPQAFKQFVDKERTKNTDPDRFTMLAKNEKLFNYGQRGALCLRYETTAIDNHAHTAKSEYETMHITNEGLVCRSPYDPHFGITVIYSYRYHPKDADETLSSKFNQLISTLHFEPISQKTRDD
ncbi:MAG: hypothetical protein ACRES9_09510 [Gammaproteobacteria bacterium]